MYLIAGPCSSESNGMEWEIICTSNVRRETILPVSDRWQYFLCPFGRKGLDVRKSSVKKIERFEFTPVDHILSV